MTFHEFIVSIVHARTAVLVAGVLGLCGCATVGPQSITAGRGVYAEVINRTEDEQILNVIVRLRYDETFGMMSVASVTANLRFSTQAGANIGVGDSDSYAGNLVPLSAGVAYEENPTISYVPLSGEDFMRRMLSPVSTSERLLIGGPARHPGHVFALAVRRVNGLRNPLLGEEPPSPAFARFVELYRPLATGRRAGQRSTSRDQHRERVLLGHPRLRGCARRQRARVPRPARHRGEARWIRDPLAGSRGDWQFRLCDSPANAIGLGGPPGVRGRHRDPLAPPRGRHRRAAHVGGARGKAILHYPFLYETQGMSHSGLCIHRKSVNYVSGIKCRPCLRSTPIDVWCPGDDSNVRPSA